MLVLVVGIVGGRVDVRGGRERSDGLLVVDGWWVAVFVHTV